MSERVSIGKSYSDAGFGFGIFLGVLGVVGGGILMALDEPGIGIPFLGGGVVASLFAIVRGILISRGRRWISPNADGFTLEDRRGTFEFTDDDITDLGTWAKPRFKDGVPKAILRKCHFMLLVGEASAPLEFEYEYSLKVDDPLSAMLDRNLDRLTEYAEDSRRRGEELVGDGWILERQELVLRAGKVEDAHPLSELSAVDLVDGKVCLWLGADAEPTAKIPAGSPNALILARILSKELAARPKRDDDHIGDGLGRILFQRDNSTSRGTLGCSGLVVFLIAALGAWIMFECLFLLKVVDEAGVFMGATLAFGIPAIWSVLYMFRRKVFRCHTRGVCMLTRREKRLMYEDIGSFTYGATRHYYNGVYTGTVFNLRFEPRSEQAGDRITYTATIKNADGELDNLRDHISQVLAFKMLKRLQDGREVKWAGATFQQDGLELPSTKMFGRGEPRHLPYGEIAGTNMEDGHFYLFATGEKKSVFGTPVSAKNFFPGLILLQLILNPPQPEVTEPEAKPDVDA